MRKGRGRWSVYFLHLATKHPNEGLVPSASHFGTQNMTANADGFKNTSDYIPENVTVSK